MVKRINVEILFALVSIPINIFIKVFKNSECSLITFKMYFIPSEEEFFPLFFQYISINIKYVKNSTMLVMKIYYFKYLTY